MCWRQGDAIGVGYRKLKYMVRKGRLDVGIVFLAYFSKLKGVAGIARAGNIQATRLSDLVAQSYLSHEGVMVWSRNNAGLKQRMLGYKVYF